MSNLSNKNVHASVQHYLNLGLQPIPVPIRTKIPVIKKWPTLQVTPETVARYFKDSDQGVGIVFEQIADLDLDILEAVAAARILAPETRWKYGHESKPDSHWMYSVEGKVISAEYRDPTDNSMVAELRCRKLDGTRGNMSVVPPSVHASGESIEWSAEADPSVLPDVRDGAELHEILRLIAGVALSAKYFPASGRHNCMLALAGTLARSGIPEGEAEIICVTTYLSVQTHDPTALDRVRQEVAATYKQFRANSPLTSYKTLKEFFAPKVLKKALEWVGAGASPVEEAPTEAMTAGCISQQITTAGRPVIQTDNRDLRDKSFDVLDILHANNNPPVLFNRAGATVKFSVIGDAPDIVRVSDHVMVSRMTDVASFTKGAKLIDPPPIVATDVLLRLPSDPRFPELVGTSATPIVRPDGTIFLTPGYDPETKRIYVPPAGFSMPALPESPTPEDIQKALSDLKSVICDFPFETEADQANAIGLILTSVLRSAICGNNPFFLITATKERTGKGLLLDVVSTLATGRRSQIRPVPKLAEDWKPEITTALQDSPILVIFDNLPKGCVLDSDDLCVLATAKEWVARKYHTNDQQHVLPVTGTWIFTGNGLQVGGEIPARCIRIAMDAQMSDPQLRSEWKHDPLLSYVEANRGDLIWAILVLARAWFAAGRPKPTTCVPLGNFEEMTIMIGGILEFAGLPLFRANEKTLRNMDSDNTQFEAFLEALSVSFRGKPFLANEVYVKVSAMREYDLSSAIPDCLREGMERQGTFTCKLGKLLTSRLGTRYGIANVYVESSPCGNATKYRIQHGAESIKGASLEAAFDPEEPKKKPIRSEKSKAEMDAEVDAMFDARFGVIRA